MLCKIILSKDRKYGQVYFDTHSIGFHHSEGRVWELIYEIVIQPGIRLEQLAKEREDRYLSSLEKTVEIDLIKINKAA